MSGTRPDDGSAPDSAPRPLPARPNLEFERKRAKKLLREMRRADVNAKLADAQFAIAREYGFSSWPKLVRYYTTLALHERSSAPPAWYPLDHFERSTQSILARHANGRFGVALSLIAYIPRFYGQTVDHVLGSTVTIDDARLVAARENRLASWDALVEYVEANAENYSEGWNRHESPLMKSMQAMRAGDIDALSTLIDAHPELLEVNPRSKRGPGSALYNALHMEFRNETPRAREIVDYLVSRGANLQYTLNWMLMLSMGYGHWRDEDREARHYVQFLLDRGAQFDWTPPNGYTVLEHMLVRQHATRHLDLVLKHVTPPKKLWVAAGLGDVKSLQRYFDHDGKLTEAGRRNRPDLTALGPGSAPMVPDASDKQILAEAFGVAMMNEKYDAMEYLIEHGFPVDYPIFGWTAMWHAVNMCEVRFAEFLLKHGAKPDLKGATTPQERDQWLLEADPTDPNARRIYELCGGTNADAVLERYRELQQQPPELTPPYLKMLEVARDDAAHQRQPAITDENIWIAFLRDERAFPGSVVGGYGVDIRKLREDYATRLSPIPATTDALPLDDGAQATVDAAIAWRMSKHWRQVSVMDLFRSLLSKDNSPVVKMLVERGLQFDKMRKQMDGW